MDYNYQVEVVKFKDMKVDDVHTKGFSVLDDAVAFAESRERQGRLVTIIVNWKRSYKKKRK